MPMSRRISRMNLERVALLKDALGQLLGEASLLDFLVLQSLCPMLPEIQIQIKIITAFFFSLLPLLVFDILWVCDDIQVSQSLQPVGLF